MTTFETKMVNTKTKLIAFFIILVLIGIRMWIVDYNQYMNNPSIGFSGVIIAIISAGILAYKTAYRKSVLILFVMAAHVVAFFIKLVIDCRDDPTNHNLWPFEIGIYLVLDGVGCSIVTMITKAARKRQNNLV